MVILSPLVRLDDSSTREVWKSIPVRLLTVRMQDVLTDTAEFNRTFSGIKESGGVHGFLGSGVPILMSSIMTDELISKTRLGRFIRIVEALGPDFYMTPDGETYDGEERTSWSEIDRVLALTKKVISRCGVGTPIGLVKGCNELQVDYHVDALKSMGINSYVFHTGDFFRNGSPAMIKKARFLCSRIRPHADRLILYGMGSQKRLLEFSFADAYITYSHFVSARYGRRIYRSQKREYRGGYDLGVIQDNLSEIYSNVQRLRLQKRLRSDNRWEEEIGVAESAMQQVAVPVPA